jgi:ABC-type multidrug transport system fused ATPase/permease subunit
LLKSPLSWFDVTPTGRIISRTTKDQDDLDVILAMNFQFVAQNLIMVFSSIILISIATPFYLILALISVVCCAKLVGMYMKSSR